MASRRLETSEAIAEEFARLQTLTAQICAKPQDDARRADECVSLVRHFRILRESVTSLNLLSLFSIRVYEASVEACLMAGNFDEYIKSLSVLLDVHYSGVGGAHARRDEFEAQLILFYSTFCWEPYEVCIRLRHLSLERLQGPDIAFALDVHRAVEQRNYLRYFRLLERNRGHPMRGPLLTAGAPRIRRDALVTMQRAYRQLSKATIMDFLGLPSPSAVTELVNLTLALPPGQITEDMILFKV